MSIVSIILKEANLNEIFGFSQKEKDAKRRKQIAAKASQEIDKFDFNNMWRQDGAGGKDGKELVLISLHQAKMVMPALAQLYPEMFELKGVSSGMRNFNGQDVLGYIPAQWRGMSHVGVFDVTATKQVAVDLLK